MRETEAVVERVWRVASDIQRLELRVEESLRYLEAGQILLAESASYLREQWLPVEVSPQTLIVERHMDSAYLPGQRVSLLAPIGNGFQWTAGHQKRLLLIAYDTYPTALLMLANKALAQSASVALILLGKAINYPAPALPSAIEVIVGHESAAWPDQNKTLLWADQIFAVSHDTDYFSELFQMVKQLRMSIPVNFFYGVYQPPMPCGTGACMACMVRCKTTNKLACMDGMSFDLTEMFLA